MDETYINSDHHQKKGWSDDSTEGPRKPVSKGPRIIILHAGSEKGFVPNSLLIFRPETKAEDYHDNMNTENYKKYVTEILIPNLPKNSVVVIYNAPYHNVQVERVPNTSNRKDEIKAWLTDKNILFDDKMLKIELLALVKQHKSRFIKYQIDELFKAAGHTILRLPAYHPDLNPIENIWGIVKQRVAARNVTYNINDLIKITKEEFEQITVDTWRKTVRHAVDVEMRLVNTEVEIEALLIVYLMFNDKI